MNIIVGITGASGSIYAKRLLDYLVDSESVEHIGLIYTSSAEQVWKYELGETLYVSDKVKVFDNHDFFTPPASGSSLYDAMVVIPCSMGTLGKIAGGIADNLITRAADVMLKEQRKLILVPREAPYNLIHVENMQKILLAGAHIIPASPSFYSKPESITELVDTIIYKILSNLNVKHQRKLWADGL